MASFSSARTSEFAGAKFRNLASQEIADIRLMNLESLFQVRLVDASNGSVSPGAARTVIQGPLAGHRIKRTGIRDPEREAGHQQAAGENTGGFLPCPGGSVFLSPGTWGSLAPPKSWRFH